MPSRKPIRIESITATNFRGASRKSIVAFDPSKSFSLLFGENACGKSTMIDAIDLVFNETSGSLEGKSSVTPKQHLPTIGAKASDISVSITAGGRSWSAKMQGKDIVVEPAGPRPKVAVLRRGKMLRLIEAKPADRFKELKSFIEVDGVQASEDALKKASGEANKTATDKSRIQEEAEAALKLAFEQDHIEGEVNLSPRDWGKARSEQDSKSLESLCAQIEKLRSVNENAATALANRDRAQTAFNEQRGEKEKLEKQVEDFKEMDAKKGVSLIEVLKKAEAFLQQSPDSSECPVCTKPIASSTLLEDIRRRVTENSQLAKLAADIEANAKRYSSTKSRCEEAHKAFASSVIALHAAIKPLPEDFVGDLDLSGSPYSRLLAWDSKSLSKDIIADAKTAYDSMKSCVERFQPRSKAAASQLFQLTSIRREYKRLIDAESEATRHLAIKGVLDEMLKIVRAQRIAFTQKVLNDVADDCDDLYKRIHPKEKLGGVRFTLDEAQRGSLDLEGEFEGESQVVPQAYFSDSHLDTLGFSFFFAVTRQTLGTDTCVVLDDVFTTVDLQHIERLLAILLEEAKTFDQIVFTTHQRRWLDLLRSPKFPTQDYCLVELNPWALDRGITTTNPQPILVELEEMLGSPNPPRQHLAASVGVALENVLGIVIGTLGLSLKQNPVGRFTAHDFVCAVKGAASKIAFPAPIGPSGQPLPIMNEPPPVAEFAEKVIREHEVRNLLGGHFNWDAADVQTHEVIDYARNAFELCKAFLCPDCGTVPSKDFKQYVECGCKRRFRINKPKN